METSIDDVMTNEMQVSVASPHSVILHVGDHRREALLVAATEGVTRFVTSAPGESGREGDGIAASLQLLSDLSGHMLTPDDIETILVHGRPLRASVVGQPSDDDWAALRKSEQGGIVRIVTARDAPPRGGSRLVGWVEQTAEQFKRGECDLLIVALPHGDLPDWAAQLINDVLDSSRRVDRHLVVVASGADGLSTLLPEATVLGRNDALRRKLAGCLARISASRLVPSLPAHVHALGSVAAVAAGVSFARQDADETIVYLDISEGSTAVIARPLGVELLRDAACDLASGAVALLHRFGADEVARWVPFPIEAAALRTWAVRRVAAPRAYLIDSTDHAIAGGFARAALRALLATAAPHTPTRCIVGPGLLRIGMPADVLRVLADIVPAAPQVIVETDADDLLPIVGYLATHAPASARSLLAHDAPAPLGTLMGIPSRGGGKAGSVRAISVDGESAMRIPLAEDDLTAVAVPSARTVRMIWHDGREEAVVVRGGPGGLMVDTRARPLRGVGTSAGIRGNVSNRLRVAAGEDTRRG